MKIFKLNNLNKGDKRILENLKTYLREWNFEEDKDRAEWLKSLPTLYGTIVLSKYEYDEQKVSALLAYSKDRLTAEQTAALVKQFFKTEKIEPYMPNYLKELNNKLSDKGISGITIIDSENLRSYTEDGYRGNGSKKDTWIARLNNNEDFKIEILNFIYGEF